MSQINNIGYYKPILIVNNHIYCKAYYVGKRHNNRLILGSRQTEETSTNSKSGYYVCTIRQIPIFDNMTIF